MPAFVFETTPKIICEQGGSHRLGEIAAGLGMQRVFVVTDKGLMQAGLLAPALASLQGAGIQTQVFSDVQADPPELSVQNAVDAALAFGADGVVGLGGGSSMDTAKLVALLARTPQKLPDIYGIGLA
nr:iron-containing alcohol dehydrogenase [Aquabacterium sp.]